MNTEVEMKIESVLIVGKFGYIGVRVIFIHKLKFKYKTAGAILKYILKIT